MGDLPPDPEPPPQPTSSLRNFQVSERRRSREHSRPQLTVPEEVQQIPLDAQILRGSQEMVSNQISRGWSQEASLTPNENFIFQAEEAQRGGIEYPSLNTGFPSEVQPQTYLSEGRLQASHNASLMLQQLQQGEGNLLQQLESAYQEPRADLLGQYTRYQREDLQFSQDTQHGPYLRDDPALQFSPSEPGFMPFNMEVTEPEPRELAVQNAKAYLLQTSVNCDLSL